MGQVVTPAVSDSRAVPTSGFSAAEVVGFNDAREGRSIRAKHFQTNHVKPLRAFGPDAQPLIEHLQNSGIEQRYKQYEVYNAAAIVHQERYRSYAKWLMRPLWATLFFCLLLLIPPRTAAQWFAATLNAWSPWAWLKGDADAWEVFIREWLPRTIFFLLLAPIVLAPLLRPASQLIKWRVNRANAEALRRDIFVQFMRYWKTEAERRDPWLLQLKLEYFRRWQVDVQKAYFGKRPAELRKAQKRALWAKVIYGIVLIAFGASLLAAWLSSLDEQGYMHPAQLFVTLRAHAAMVEAAHADLWVLIVLGVTIMAACALVYQATIGNDLQNAKRYTKMSENFRYITTEALETARQAAAKGNEAGVQAYVDRVHSMMSLELNDWVDLQSLDSTPAPSSSPAGPPAGQAVTA